MGLIQKLRDLFEQQNIPQEVVVSLHDLEQWLESEIQSVIRRSGIQKKILVHSNKLKEKRWIIEINTEELLAQNKSPELIPLLNEFLSQFYFPEQMTSSNILDLNQTLLENLPGLLKVIDPSQRIQHAIQQELYQIKEIIHEFEQVAEEISLSRFDSLRSRVKNLLQSQEKIVRLQEYIKEKNEKFQQAEKKREEKEKELQEAREDPTYKSIIEHKKKRKDLRSKSQHYQEKLLNYFTKINPALEQYSKFGSQPLLQTYLQSPLKALKQDESLSVLHTIQHLRALISNENVSLPLEKVTAIIETIDNINLETLARTYFSTERELESARPPPIPDKLEEVQYRLAHFTSQVDRLSDEVLQLDTELTQQKNSLRQELNHFQRLLGVNLRKQVTISL